MSAEQIARLLPPIPSSPLFLELAKSIHYASLTSSHRQGDFEATCVQSTTDATTFSIVDLLFEQPLDTMQNRGETNIIAATPHESTKPTEECDHVLHPKELQCKVSKQFQELHTSEHFPQETTRIARWQEFQSKKVS